MTKRPQVKINAGWYYYHYVSHGVAISVVNRNNMISCLKCYYDVGLERRGVAIWLVSRACRKAAMLF